MASHLVYTGMFDEVWVPDLNRVVKQGEPVEVTDADVAANLLLQSDNWARATSKATAASAVKRAEEAREGE